jgi:hypothetical protein
MSESSVAFLQQLQTCIYQNSKPCLKVYKVEITKGGHIHFRLIEENDHT